MKGTTKTESERGYRLHLDGYPIARCDSIDQARGWLESEYGQHLYLSAMAEAPATMLPPRCLTDTDIAGLLNQADDIAERRAAYERVMGWD